MTGDDASYGEQGLQLDFGEPKPNVCTDCHAEFERELAECPECGHPGYGYSLHPQDEWTPQLVRQLVKAGAGYVAIRASLSADHQAFMWWNEGFEGRGRGPGGSWDSFDLGMDETLEDAHTIELVHCTECPPSIAHQMRGKRGDR